jgi:hypothetical protein
VVHAAKDESGGGARAGARRAGECCLREIVAQYGDLLDGKVVVDSSNHVSWHLPEGHESAASVIVELLPPGVRFVKAFGTLASDSLASEANRTPRGAVLFYATDDGPPPWSNGSSPRPGSTW